MQLMLQSQICNFVCKIICTKIYKQQSNRTPNVTLIGLNESVFSDILKKCKYYSETQTGHKLPPGEYNEIRKACMK